MRAMRTTLWIACSIVFAACAWGESAGPDDPPGDEDPEGPVCGDGTCAASEASTCATDCGPVNPVTCNNNGTCDSGETMANCAADCTPAVTCPNGTCDNGEDNSTCPQDCPTSGLDCSDDLIGIACGVCIATGNCELGTSPQACLECAFTLDAE